MCVCVFCLLTDSTVSFPFRSNSNSKSQNQTDTFVHMKRISWHVCRYSSFLALPIKFLMKRPTTWIDIEFTSFEMLSENKEIDRKNIAKFDSCSIGWAGFLFVSFLIHHYSCTWFCVSMCIIYIIMNDVCHLSGKMSMSSFNEPNTELNALLMLLFISTLFLTLSLSLSTFRID